MPRTSRLPGPLLRRSAVAAVALAACPAVLAVSSASAAPAASAAAPTAPPPVTVLTGSASKHDGDIFISPFGDQTTYANGPEILTGTGKVVWFKAVPAGEEASDFRAQTYHGKPVLTWWQGTGLGGVSSGTDYIYNRSRCQRPQAHRGTGST